MEKPDLSIKHKSSSGNDEKGTPSTTFASVPTKSSEMASKILQDSFDWEDDNHSNGVALPAPAEDRERQKASDSDSKITEAINTGQRLAASDIKTSVTSYTRISDGALSAEKNAAFTVASVLSTEAAVASFSQQNTTSEKASLTTESNKTTLVSSSSGDKVSSSAGLNAVCSKPICSVGDKVSQPTEFNVTPIFSFGDKVTPAKEVNATSNIISFDSKNVDKTPKLAHTPPFWVPGQSDPGVGALPASISGSSSGLETTAAGVTASKDPESEKSNQVHDTAFSLSASPPTAAAGIFSFGASANGSLATTHSSSSTSSVSLSNFTGQSASSSPAFTASILGSSSINFESATVPSTMSSQVATTPSPKSDDKTKHGTNLSNMSSSPFGGSSSITNTGSSIFGLAPVTTSTPNISSQGSTPFSYGFGATASSPFTAQASFSGSGVITSTQSVQVSSSASSSSQTAFGSTLTSSQPASGSFSASFQLAFGSSSASSQPAFGNTSASSQLSSTVTLSQPAFGSFSASFQLSFGSSSASSQPAFANTSASSQQAFGNTSASSQPAFGNHSSAYPFGSASSGHNDQMSMEDSMAEDVQASAPAPTTSVVGQQSISPQQSGFVFGSTTSPGPSPSQFGGQQNLSTPQNPSPFKASGCLDFKGGGSFSLGSGGGDKAKRKIVIVKNCKNRKS